MATHLNMRAGLWRGARLPEVLRAARCVEPAVGAASLRWLARQSPHGATLSAGGRCPLSTAAHAATSKRPVSADFFHYDGRCPLSTAARAAASKRPVRADFFHYERLMTRWNDNDAFGHINNVIYYSFFDDAVNAQLIRCGIGASYPRFVASSSCVYFAPLAYPQQIDVGLGVTKLGNSSVAYSIGIFAGEEGAVASQPAAACGTFVHVYVDAAGRPTPLAQPVRDALQSLLTAVPAAT